MTRIKCRHLPHRRWGLILFLVLFVSDFSFTLEVVHLRSEMGIISERLPPAVAVNNVGNIALYFTQDFSQRHEL